MAFSRIVVTVTVAAAVGPVLALAPAHATPQVGTCTNSYQPYTYEQLAFDPDAQAIFAVIDTNHDNVICFKPYPNGDHAGHAGNLVDDKAAPHT